MTFKNCPQCKGRGTISTTEYGATTIECCPLCRERTLWKNEFERVSKNLEKNGSGNYEKCTEV